MQWFSPTWAEVQRIQGKINPSSWRQLRLLYLHYLSRNSFILCQTLPADIILGHLDIRCYAVEFIDNICLMSHASLHTEQSASRQGSLAQFLPSWQGQPSFVLPAEELPAVPILFEMLQPFSLPVPHTSYSYSFLLPCTFQYFIHCKAGKAGYFAIPECSIHQGRSSLFFSPYPTRQGFKPLFKNFTQTLSLWGQIKQ